MTTTTREALLAAVTAVVRDALDNIEVHPCDYDNDAIRAKGLPPIIRGLYDALAAADAEEAKPAPEPVAWHLTVSLEDDRLREEFVTTKPDEVHLKNLARAGYAWNVTPLYAALPAPVDAQPASGAVPAPKFKNVSCSQCGADFGPGDNGFSRCDEHRKKEQPASGAVDERERFEHHMHSCEMIKARWGKLDTYRMESGHYMDGIMHAGWSAWQARAALSAVNQVNAPESRNAILEEVATSFVHSFKPDDRLDPAYIAACIMTHKDDSLYPVNQVNAAQQSAIQLSELLRGLEAPPTAATMSPRALFLMGQAIASQAKNAAHPEGCHRSHPHEDMDAECQIKTEEARLSSAIERGTKAWANTQPGWVDDLRGGEPAAQPEKDAGRLATISAYSIGDIKVEVLRQIDGPSLWAVRRRGDCLNKSGEWEYEPLPSSRDDDFLSRCRFRSASEAIRAAISAQPAKSE